MPLIARVALCPYSLFPRDHAASIPQARSQCKSLSGFQVFLLLLANLEVVALVQLVMIREWALVV